MEIVILILLFLVGTVGGAYQALRYLERGRRRKPSAREDDKKGPEQKT